MLLTREFLRLGAGGGLFPLVTFTRRPGTVAATLLAVSSSAAFGQPTTPVDRSDQSSSVQSNSIVVTGTRPYTQNLIDRKSYDISKDLQSASGTAADALRTIPSVDVDAQGAVSIRGDSNIQILIDGKPSTTMSSRTRADALEQLPASAIDHIEVITTPGAQYKPDASGGVINIITKQQPREAGASGDIHASAGTDGSLNLDGTLSHHGKRWTLTGSANLRRDVRWRPFKDHRIEIDPSGGQTIVDQNGNFGGPRLTRTATGTIAYDASRSDRLSLHGSYEYRTGEPHLAQRNLVQDPSGAVTSDYARYATGDEDEVDSEVSGSYRHQFAGKDHQFTLNLRRGESVENENRLFHSFYEIPAGLQEIDEQFPRADEVQRELTAEYSTPIGGGKLLAGYDREQDDDDFHNRGIFIDPVSQAQTVDPSRTNRFHYRQTIDAWYLNFDRSIDEKFSVSAGVRLESTSINTNQIDLGLRHHSNYFKAYPSLHLEYDLGRRQKLRLGYSHRVVRPDPEDLDPYPVFSDPLTERAGNPQLKPEETQAIEVEYERPSKLGTLDVTAFLRRTTNEFTQVSRLIPPNVILTTHENLGSSTKFGIDASDEGKLSPAIAYRVSGSIYRDEVNAANLGILERRTIEVANAKAGLDVNLTKDNLFQVDANYRGRTLTAQGYRLASFVADAGIRHTFPHHIVATLAVSDLFDSRRDRIRLATTSLQETIVRRNGGRKFSVALALPFGRSISAPSS